MTDLTLRPATREDAEIFASWTYPEPYSMYDASPEDAGHYLDEGYLTVVRNGDEVVAHCCFGPDARVPGGRYEHDAIDIGAGMRPDLTGQGRGRELLEVVMNEARRRDEGRLLRATIAAFNERALQLVRSLGFQEVEIFANPSGREFVVLIREA